MTRNEVRVPGVHRERARESRWVRRRARLHVWLLLLGMAALLFGCRQEPDVRAGSWELEVPGEPVRAVGLPTHLDLPPHDLTYHLRARLELPEELRGKDLTLALPYLSARVEASADGHPLTLLREDLGDTYRYEGAHAWRVPAELTAGPTVAIDLAVAHRWAHSGWLETVPRLLPATGKDAESARVRLVNHVGGAVGWLVIGFIGLTYLIVFLTMPGRKAYLWFGVQAITAAYFPFWVLGGSQPMLGRFDFPLLGAALVTAPIASVYFTHDYFKLPPPSRAWPCLLGVALVVVVFQHGPYCMLPSQIVVTTVFLVVGYQLVTCTRLLLREPAPDSAGLILLCWVTLGVAAWTDLLAWAGLPNLAPGLHPASIGLALFGFLQSLILSRDYVRSLRRSDTLNAALATRVQLLEASQRDIERLNEELRRQVARRSERLAEALIRAGAASDTVPELAPDDILDDRYRVVRRVGAGAMGVVYEVVRLSDGRRLALKVTTRSTPASFAALAREAQVAAGVVHPNIVGIVDVDIASGVIFLVMEYVDGTPLAERVARFGDVPWARSILLQVARGLFALHTARLVHRDLKPANILLTGAQNEPVVKISDFGVSYQAAADEAPLEGPRHSCPEAAPVDEDATGVLPGRGRQPAVSGAPPRPSRPHEPAVGTPRYMAPELASHAAATSASDIFAFGLVAFELLARTYPFEEAPVLALSQGRPIPAPTSLAESGHGLSPALVGLVMSCLATEPSERPNADALVRALEEERVEAG